MCWSMNLSFPLTVASAEVLDYDFSFVTFLGLCLGQSIQPRLSWGCRYTVMRWEWWDDLVRRSARSGSNAASRVAAASFWTSERSGILEQLRGCVRLTAPHPHGVRRALSCGNPPAPPGAGCQGAGFITNVVLGSASVGAPGRQRSHSLSSTWALRWGNAFINTGQWHRRKAVLQSQRGIRRGCATR